MEAIFLKKKKHIVQYSKIFAPEKKEQQMT